MQIFVHVNWPVCGGLNPIFEWDAQFNVGQPVNLLSSTELCSELSHAASNW